MRKSDKKPWWQAVADGDTVDHSAENLKQRVLETHNDIQGSLEMESEGAGQSPSVLDGTSVPPPIQQPSQFNTLPSPDPNSTAPHEDLFGPELKPSPAPARDVELLSEVELDREIAAAAQETKLGHIPPATAVAPHPIHSDGVSASSFVGEVPGTGGVVFSNPGRRESRKVHVQAAHEIAKK
jgi:hypothetical protein